MGRRVLQLSEMLNKVPRSIIRPFISNSDMIGAQGAASGLSRVTCTPLSASSRVSSPSAPCNIVGTRDEGVDGSRLSSVGPSRARTGLDRVSSQQT